MSSVSTDRLKREARRLSRAGAMPHHAALDRIAQQRGYASWSLLVANSSGAAASGILAMLNPGDLIVLAARPGQGKTLYGLALAAKAVRHGRSSTFFTLEDTEAVVSERLRRIGAEDVRSNALFSFDASDAICADHVMAASSTRECGSVLVIDYLQKLDQRRETPVLADQVGALKAFARVRGSIVILISQVDPILRPSRQIVSRPE